MDDRLAILIDGYLHETLDEADRAELAALVAGDAGSAGELCRQVRLHVMLHTALSPTDEAAMRRRAELVVAIEDHPTLRITDKRRRLLLPWAGALAASLLIAALVAVWLSFSTTSPAQHQFADGTSLRFTGKAVVDAITDDADGKRIVLRQGMIDANVAKQPPGKPMRIETPWATVTVLGTVLSVAAEPSATHVMVREGRVRVEGVDKQVVEVGAGEQAIAAAGHPLVTRWSGRRDPALWPFAPDDPLNHPIGSAARYERLDWSAAAPPDEPLRVRFEARNVYQAAPTDPVRRVYEAGRPSSALSIPVPPSLPLRADSGESVIILMPDHLSSVEMMLAMRQRSGDIEAAALVRFDLRTAGFYAEPLNGFARRSSLGGMIRAGELRTGIRHALTIAVSQNMMRRDPAGSFRAAWPMGRDADPRRPGAVDFIAAGNLLAIPPSVDLTALHIPDGSPAYHLAQALRDYGAYVITGAAPAAASAVFVTDTQARGEISSDLADLAAQLLPLLHVVGNNTPTTPGGGGTPLKPLAPYFIEPPAAALPGASR